MHSKHPYCTENTYTSTVTNIQIFKVLLDLKECLDSIVLMYNEEDSDCPVLTTNALQFGQKSKEHRWKGHAEMIEKNINSFMDAVWKRQSQYLKVVRHRPNTRRKSRLHKSFKSVTLYSLRGVMRFVRPNSSTKMTARLEQSI